MLDANLQLLTPSCSGNTHCQWQ